jgi:hypothetical protein
MKSLNEYIVESKQTFTYRVKYAGDFDQEKQDLMKEVFAKFDVESTSAIKKTPVMKSPYDFPELENEEVSSYEVTLNYPASASQIVELARAKGCDINRLKIMDKRFADSVDAEEAVEQPEVLLDDPTFPDPTAEQKEASAEYAKTGEERRDEAETTEYEIEKGEDNATAGEMK